MARTVLAIDPGTRRLGVAVSDPLGMVALPLTVLPRSGDWIGELRRIIAERGVDEVVMGLPLRLDGTEGPAAEQARVLAGELRIHLGVEIRLVDERLTTVAAERGLTRAGASARRQRKVVDKAAAALLLQSYLDAHQR
ncbi:MAG: Holliday junction resolvase RuvX [Actinomycetota bacterium]